jgi:hypothetical protein
MLMKLYYSQHVSLVVILTMLLSKKTAATTSKQGKVMIRWQCYTIQLHFSIRYEKWKPQYYNQ